MSIERIKNIECQNYYSSIETISIIIQLLSVSDPQNSVIGHHHLEYHLDQNDVELIKISVCNKAMCSRMNDSSTW